MRRLAMIATVALILATKSAAPFAADTADVVGAWNLAYTTTEGQKITSVLTLKIEAGELAGTISSPRGSVAIAEASVKGDRIAFAVIRIGFGDKIRIDYTGTVKGDRMKLVMKAGTREPLDVAARRADAPAPSAR